MEWTNIVLSTSLNCLSKSIFINKSTATIINEERSKINEWLNINNLFLNKTKPNTLFFICLTNEYKLLHLIIIITQVLLATQLSWINITIGYN